MLKSLAKYIENQTTLVIGTTLFAGFIPSEVTGPAVVMMETGGPPHKMLTDRINPTVMFRSRAVSYWDSRELIFIVWELLRDPRFNVTLPIVDSGGVYMVNAFDNLQMPSSIGQDANGQHEFSTNFIVRASIES